MWVAILNRSAREGLTDGANLSRFQGEEVPGRGKSKCKVGVQSV